MHGNDHSNQFEKSDYYQESLIGSRARSTVGHPSLESLLTQFKTYKPKSGIVSMKDLSQSQNLKLKKYKDAAYYGEFINGKRHGMGIMLYNNSRLYQGLWQCDYKHGKGYEQFQSGCVYKGFYVNGKPQGLGKFQWPNGQFYQGEWMGGLKHGTGMWNGAKGDSYVGEWKSGKADGYGVHVWVNGDRYEGQFRQSLKHGQGMQKFVSGDLYKGSFYMGKPTGYGEYFWADGSFYKGDFKNGFRQGNGIWKKGPGNCDKYEGEYIKDKKQGYGIYTWITGNVYKGYYYQDLREGYGEMFWTDGMFYNGEWRKGNQEGVGILFTPQTGIKRGRFSNNQLVELYEQIEAQKFKVNYKKPQKRRKSNPGGDRYNSAPRKHKYQYLSVQANPKHNAPISQKNLSKASNRSPSSRNLPNESAFPPAAQRSHRSIFTSRQAQQLLQAKQLSPIKEDIKEGIPHSSIQMKYLDRRLHDPSMQRKQIRMLRNHFGLGRKGQQVEINASTKPL